MDQFFTTREVARFLKINEKMVYSLVSEKGLPASKVTGKWLFPKNLVAQWVEAHTINYPKSDAPPSLSPAVLIITGSNDILLDKIIAMYNAHFSGQIAVFANLGSMGGLRALRRNLCHIAASHLLQEDDSEYNFEFADRELDMMPAVVTFCKRQQGILVAAGNPKNITAISDFSRPGLRMANRPLGTGTRLLLDQELKKAGIAGARIDGYDREAGRHLDVGLDILAGRADVGLGIHAVAGLLNLDFIPLRWERYDLMIFKDQFFNPGIQQFLGLLHEAPFIDFAKNLKGYDIHHSGQMRYPKA